MSAREAQAQFNDRSVFEFKEYKAYLKAVLGVSGSQRGLRSRLAEELNCNTAFISQVLNGTGEFSLEHSVRVSKFLGHTQDEASYFILLVHEGRAGTRELREFYAAELEKMLKKRGSVRERVRMRPTLTADEQTVYFSEWHYAAIHALAMIPKFQSRNALVGQLKLPPEIVSAAIETLLSIGILIQKGTLLKPSSKRIHIPNDSPMVNRHHANWRMQAIHSLLLKRKEDMHYSAIITVSEANVAKVDRILQEALSKIEPLLAEENEETALALGIDLFRVS